MWYLQRDPASPEKITTPHSPPVESAPVARHDDIRQAPALLFKAGLLADANAGGARLLGSGERVEDLVEVMQARFPGIEASLDEDNAEDNRRELPSALTDDAAHLSLERRGETLSVTLLDPKADASDRHLWLTGSAAVSLIDGLIGHAPLAIWALAQDGTLLHANAAFHDLLDKADAPLPFDLEPDDPVTTKRRVWTEDPETGTRHWYDLSSEQLPGGIRVFFASNADAIVGAEIAQRNFVQTLTKTFAHLSIGLAIFDRHRQLALFNPALIDLTALPADFLSARPTLAGFFDQLRDRQIMPEPRNYNTWRDQLSDMINAAHDGAYCETWTLPTGLTYRVSGKPHPDGAVAFLFEDISAEITLTRRFRAELEQSQAVIDAMDTAIAVFSRSGVLTFTNEAFRSLWECAPDESFLELTIADVARLWQERCAVTSIWDDLRDFIASVDGRASWRASVIHHDAGPLTISAAPLSGGATLVRFSTATAPARLTEDAPEADPARAEASPAAPGMADPETHRAST